MLQIQLSKASLWRGGTKLGTRLFNHICAMLRHCPRMKTGLQDLRNVIFGPEVLHRCGQIWSGSIFRKPRCSANLLGGSDILWSLPTCRDMRHIVINIGIPILMSCGRFGRKPDVESLLDLVHDQTFFRSQTGATSLIFQRVGDILSRLFWQHVGEKGGLWPLWIDHASN